MSAELSVALQRCLLGGKSGAGNIQFYCSQLIVSLLSFLIDVSVSYLVLILLDSIWLLIVVAQETSTASPSRSFC